jgi:hypothetical protein
MEKLCSLMQKWVSAQHLQSCSMQLYQHHVVNMVIRNGDALCETMHSMIPDFKNLAAIDFAMRPTIARIAYLWGCGAAIHSQTLAQDFYDCSKSGSMPFCVELDIIGIYGLAPCIAV